MRDEMIIAGISEKELSRILKEWLKNPYWAEYYSGAPSDRCREFIALEFYYSEHEEEETGKEMDRIEAEMDQADLRHLLRYCGNNLRKKVLLDRIARL